jgi:hypothetical protein
MTEELQKLAAIVEGLAEERGLFVHSYEEARLSVVELHSTARKKGPGSERFVRFTGFTPTKMYELARVCLMAMELPDKPKDKKRGNGK